jgi:hypothetical protein
MEKKVRDLKEGDKIGGATILYVGTVGSYCGSANQVRVDVRYTNGKESTRYWNANTTIRVYEK